MKKLRIKKELGTWYYEKIDGYDLDAPIYYLYDENKNYVEAFGCIGDIRYYLETGKII